MLDDVDRTLLIALQANARATNAELAELACLSESACSRRVRALEQRGVIAGYAARIDPQAVGRGLTVFVSISLSSQSQPVLEAFETAVRGAPEIVECHLMTGEADYLVRVAVADVADLERFHTHVLTKLPGVARISSSISLRAAVSRPGAPIR
ncbi:Lrp/AsnC family transcriptional regulator [Phenylobacterium sp.]|uniref:Lrp/AsnC family transcriptional regulator n=1 Tax=Phenylobacterium sp. TaxID=1871053 RepID=UPI0035B2F0A4